MSFKISIKKSNFKTLWKDWVDDVRKDALYRGMSTKELWEKYKDKIKDIPNYLNFRNKLHTTGISSARDAALRAAKAVTKSQYKSAKKALREREMAKMNLKLQREVSKEVAATIIKRQQQGAEKHFDRMEVEIDRVAEVLEKKDVNALNVSDHLDDLGKLDGLARKLYNMDKNSNTSDHQMQLGMLVLGDAYLTPLEEGEEDGDVIDLEEEDLEPED